MSSIARFEEHAEGLIIIVAPIAGLIALIADFTWTNLLLFAILMVAWKIANGALR
jgi:hypothetical protein